MDEETDAPSPDLTNGLRKRSFKMTYLEACEATVSKKEAYYEIVKQHGCSWAEFVQEFGEHAEYNGEDVLNWLGY